MGGIGNPADIVEIRGDVAVAVATNDPASLEERVDWWLENADDELSAPSPLVLDQHAEEGLHLKHFRCRDGLRIARRASILRTSSTDVYRGVGKFEQKEQASEAESRHRSA